MTARDGRTVRPEEIDGQDYADKLVVGGHGTLEREDESITLAEMIQRGAAARRLLRAIRGGAR